MPRDGDLQRKEGELLKYKNYFSGWGKRYFRLERSYLHYFETKHSHKPIATVTRGEIREVKLSETTPDRENVFEIVHNNGTIWYCQAQTSEDMFSWLQALNPVPFVLDPKKYPMVPLASAQAVHSNVNNNSADNQATVPPPPAYNSPYKDLMDKAHCVAYMNNTPHDCNMHSLPPPYTTQPPNNPYPHQQQYQQEQPHQSQQHTECNHPHNI